MFLSILKMGIYAFYNMRNSVTRSFLDKAFQFSKAVLRIKFLAKQSKHNKRVSKHSWDGSMELRFYIKSLKF